jgi:DICT domain-containing protein
MNISLYDAVVGGFEIRRIIHSVSLMNTISNAIEKQILKADMAVDLYAGFQKLSFFEYQQATYRQLDRVCQSVTIFGIPDIPPPTFTKTEFTALEDNSPLAQEWFMVVDTPEFWTMLSTQELAPDPVTRRRRFEGLWTFDPTVVSRAARYLRHALGRPPQTITRRFEAAQEKNVTELKERMLLQIQRKGLEVTPEYIDTKAFGGGR